MELFLIFTGAFAVALSGALIPGPMLTVTVFHSLKNGFRAGPLVTLGHAVAELILLWLIILGLGPFLARPSVMRVIFTVGGTLLILTGIYMFVRRKSVTDIKNKPSSSAAGPVLSGIITSISNPTWALWWVTVGITYLTKSLTHGAAGIAAFFSGHILADLGWYGFVSYTTSKGGRLINPSVYSWFITGCALALSAFGIWFILSGTG